MLLLRPLRHRRIFSYSDHSEDVDHFYPPVALRRSISEGIKNSFNNNNKSWLNQSHLKTPLHASHSAPTAIPGGSFPQALRRRHDRAEISSGGSPSTPGLFRRRYSDFDDTWSKPYLPEDGDDDDGPSLSTPASAAAASAAAVARSEAGDHEDQVERGDGLDDLDEMFEFSPRASRSHSSSGSASTEEGPGRPGLHADGGCNGRGSRQEEVDEGIGASVIGSFLVPDALVAGGQDESGEEEGSVYGDALSRKTSLVRMLSFFVHAPVQSDKAIILERVLSCPGFSLTSAYPVIGGMGSRVTHCGRVYHHLTHDRD